MSRQPSPPAIGATVKSIRKHCNLTLEQLAQPSHVSKSMLSQIERELTNSTSATLWSLAQALDVSITELVSQTYKAANYLYLVPFLAVAIAWIWLQELPSLLSIIGGIATLIGVFLVNLPQKQ